MDAVDWDDIGVTPILLAEGFPGELDPVDTDRARTLSSSTGEPMIVVATGGGVFWCIDESTERIVNSADGHADGFELGGGDGATLAGMPLSWKLLTFGCPRGDTTLFLPQFPKDPPHCPTHGIPLELAS
jgi:hypothetical protein